jgi:hypothetical protein
MEQGWRDCIGVNWSRAWAGVRVGFRGGVKADKLSPAGGVERVSAPVRPIFVEVQ